MIAAIDWAAIGLFTLKVWAAIIGGRIVAMMVLFVAALVVDVARMSLRGAIEEMEGK